MLFSEPKIPQLLEPRPLRVGRALFQCSSASRKFLNVGDARVYLIAFGFQCSSASRKFLNGRCGSTANTTSEKFQCSFSEPKIPQFCGRRADGAPSQFQCSSASRKFLNLGGGCQRLRDCAVSVLFSEPKIPQFVILINVVDRVAHGFSALQRAENSSICGMIPLLPLV